jgi:pimeloyl-ACP methyl ester carboxylesterase
MIGPIAKWIDWSALRRSYFPHDDSNSRLKVLSMNTYRNWSIAGVAAVCFVTGIALSHRIEPGVSVQTVKLADETPALKFTPTGPGPYPVALLAHGFGGSKETLFRYAEALTAAGFVCYDVDLPGHGASARACSFMENVHTLEAVAREIGPVDVFVGHSMGGFNGGEAVREGGIKPGLFIALGSLPVLGNDAPPLLLLAARFEEFFSPALLKTRTDARLVISPWCDHVFEMWDSLLVNAAVEEACSAVDKTPPAPPTAWRWRVVGIVLALLGAGTLALYLPELFPQLARFRELLFAVFFVTFTFTVGYAWLDTAPHRWILPKQGAAMAVILLLAMVAGRLRIGRWSIIVLGLVVTAIAFCWWKASGSFAVFQFMAFMALGLTPALIVGTAIGWIAARRGSRLQGDIAMAIFVGWAAFQWFKLPVMAAETPKPHLAIKLDAKLLDSYVGQYEFPPENFMGGTGITLTIWRQGDQLSGQFAATNRRYGAFDIYPESETNFFGTKGSQYTFVKNDEGVTAVIIHSGQGLPDTAGKKLKSD